MRPVPKTKQDCFCQNFVKFPPTLLTFGTKMANTTKLCEVCSTNLCQRSNLEHLHLDW